MRMNHLNSILIEGVLREDAVFYKGGEGEERGAFGITSTRYYQEGNDLKKRVGNFSIRFSAPHMVEAARGRAMKGRGIRAVGRLETDGADTWVEAEHVEYRSEYNEKGGKKSSINKQK